MIKAAARSFAALRMTNKGHGETPRGARGDSQRGAAGGKARAGPYGSALRSDKQAVAPGGIPFQRGVNNNSETHGETLRCAQGDSKRGAVGGKARAGPYGSALRSDKQAVAPGGGKEEGEC